MYTENLQPAPVSEDNGDESMAYSSRFLKPLVMKGQFCEMCNCNIQEASLSKHMARFHWGQFPFNCHLCGKGFMSDSGLR